MRAKAMLLVVAVVASSIGGCSAVIVSRGIEATDLSAIVVGADRETVEGALGSPIDSVETKAGRIDTYRYDRGRAPKKTGRVPSIDLSGAHPNIGYALPLIGLGLLIAQPRKANCRLPTERMTRSYASRSRLSVGVENWRKSFR